jgi:hypothetical protein
VVQAMYFQGGVPMALALLDSQSASSSLDLHKKSGLYLIPFRQSKQVPLILLALKLQVHSTQLSNRDSNLVS